VIWGRTRSANIPGQSNAALLPSAGRLAGYIGVIGLAEWLQRRWCYAAIVAGAAVITRSQEVT
jgi:hypothetical protein